MNEMEKQLSISYSVSKDNSVIVSKIEFNKVYIQQFIKTKKKKKPRHIMHTSISSLYLREGPLLK